MSLNVMMVGWNRPAAGREEMSGQIFPEFMQYLGGLQQAGTIQSFETVLLTAHGGDLNGFFLIHGDYASLSALQVSEDWLAYLASAGMAMEGLGVVMGATGELVMEWMNRWNRLLAG